MRMTIISSIPNKIVKMLNKLLLSLQALFFLPIHVSDDILYGVRLAVLIQLHLFMLDSSLNKRHAVLLHTVAIILVILLPLIIRGGYL